jgi:hypothetical protein
MEQLYDVFSKELQDGLRQKFGSIFPDKPLDPSSADDLVKLEEVRGTLQQSPEYWSTLDDVYARFSGTMKELQRAGKLITSATSGIPKNEVAAKAELLIRAEYTMAVDGLKSIGLDGAWSKLGAKLKKNMKLRRGPKQMGVTNPTAYEEMLAKPEVFADQFYKSKTLNEFIANLSGNAQMANRICAELRKASPKDYRLLEAAMELKIAPDVSELPKVGFWANVGSGLRYLGRMNLASLVGGGKRGLAGIFAMVKNRDFAFALGSRRIRQKAYRSFSTSSHLYKATTPWIVAGLISSWALYHYLVPTVKKVIGLDSKPQKTEESPLDVVATTNSQRRAVSGMLDSLVVGGRKLSEQEKLDALKLASKAKKDIGKRNMTDYVRSLAILRFSGKGANAFSDLSKSICYYVNSNRREDFAKAALQVWKKDSKLDADAVFERVLRSPKMEGAISEEYWGKEFAPKIFESFKSDRNLWALRAGLRKAQYAGEIDSRQMLSLAKAFASLYSRGAGKTAKIPRTYEADLETGILVAKSGKSKDGEFPDAISALNKFVSEGKEEGDLAKTLYLKGFSLDAIGFITPDLSWYSEEVRSKASKWLLDNLEPSASNREWREKMVGHMASHVGWVNKRWGYTRYVSTNLGEMLSESPSVEKNLPERIRSKVVKYLTGRLEEKGKKALSFPQVISVIDGLSQSEDTLVKLANARSTDKFLEEYCESVLK